MLLLHTAERRQNAADPASGPPDVLVPEALIPEARIRTRRRRLAAVVLLLAGAAAGAYALLAPAGPAVIAGTAASPFADARAFSGHGELAFVSRDQMWVLDGASGDAPTSAGSSRFQGRLPDLLP